MATVKKAKKSKKEKFRLEYRVPSITGDKVHKIIIKDDLGDTWSPVKVGKASPELKAVKCTNTHDINFWTDTNDDGKQELLGSIYPYFMEENGIDIGTDHCNWTRVEIISCCHGYSLVDGKWIEIDESLIECEDCGESFTADFIRPWKYEPNIKLCENCHEERMKEEEK
jgi:hypothetical protein